MIVLAYTLASLAAAFAPLATMTLFTVPFAWDNPSVFASRLIWSSIVVIGFVMAFLVPIAVVLRRLDWFRPWAMGGAAFVVGAVYMAMQTVGAPAIMADGSVGTMPLFFALWGALFYGGLATGSAVVFWFVFVAVSGEGRARGASVEA